MTDCDKKKCVWVEIKTTGLSEGMVTALAHAVASTLNEFIPESWEGENNYPTVSVDGKDKPSYPLMMVGIDRAEISAQRYRQ